MSRSGKRSVPAILYRVLLGICILMGFAWLGGTAWALFFRDAGESALPAALPAGSPVLETGHIFTRIGRLRLSLAPPSSAMIIVSITFPYDPGDRAFSEELALRAPDLRDTAAEYFKSFSPGVLQKKDEAEIKAELLSRFNVVLRLGKIGVLYFDDFMIID
jgi:flagellar basal body-associated protein FliL